MAICIESGYMGYPFGYVVDLKWARWERVGGEEENDARLDPPSDNGVFPAFSGAARPKPSCGLS
jgi:hypothetical protein